MAFSTDSALQHLQRAHNLNRLAHAYLISGPVGSGKSIVAARFAAALNKTTPGEVLRGQAKWDRNGLFRRPSYSALAGFDSREDQDRACRGVERGGGALSQYHRRGVASRTRRLLQSVIGKCVSRKTKPIDRDAVSLVGRCFTRKGRHGGSPFDRM